MKNNIVLLVIHSLLEFFYCVELFQITDQIELPND